MTATKQQQQQPQHQQQQRDRNVRFMRTRSGRRLLILDQQWRYTQLCENDMLVFWRCSEKTRSACPAEVATTKCEANTRVWVINDTHIHKRRVAKRSTPPPPPPSAVEQVKVPPAASKSTTSESTSVAEERVKS